MEHLKAYNQKLLANILPEHVAAHFLSTVNSDVRKLMKILLCDILSLLITLLKKLKKIDIPNILIFIFV